MGGTKVQTFENIYSEFRASGFHNSKFKYLDDF